MNELEKYESKEMTVAYCDKRIGELTGLIMDKGVSLTSPTLGMLVGELSMLYYSNGHFNQGDYFKGICVLLAGGIGGFIAGFNLEYKFAKNYFKEESDEISRLKKCRKKLIRSNLEKAVNQDGNYQ